MTPVGPATITDALLLLVFCDIWSSSLSLSFESLDSILISNFHYYFQDGRPTMFYNHKYCKPYNIYDYNRRTWQDHRPVVPKLCAAAPLGAVASSQGSREILTFFRNFIFFYNFISIRRCRYSTIYIRHLVPHAYL